MNELRDITIPKGTTLSLGGIPVQLIRDAYVRTHAANVPLLTGWDGDSQVTRVARPATGEAMTPYEQHEHQFPELDHDGMLVAYPCLLCGLQAGDALKQAADDRAFFVDLLISARAIAQRRGEDTAWQRFDDRLREAGIGSVTAKTFRVLPSDNELDQPQEGK